MKSMINEENNRNDLLQYIANVDTLSKSRSEGEEEHRQCQEENFICSKNEARQIRDDIDDIATLYDSDFFQQGDQEISLANIWHTITGRDENPLSQ